MRPDQLLALQNICKTQEDLQVVWNNPWVFKLNNKFQLWVTMCVAADGPDKNLVWTACARLANLTRKSFKNRKLWTAHEILKARTVLIDRLYGVGTSLGEEEFDTTTAMHINRCLNAEEKNIVLKPHILGH